MQYNLSPNAGKIAKDEKVRVTVQRISEPWATAQDGRIVVAVTETGRSGEPDRLPDAFEFFGPLDTPTPRRRDGAGATHGWGSGP